MEWVETTGTSVEEALDAALDELGVDEDDVEYEVLEQAKAGLFGRIGGNPARVRARVRPVSREKPGERQRRNRRSGSRSRGGSGSRPTPPVKQGAARESGDAGRDAGDPPADAGGPKRHRRRGGRGRGGGSGAPAPAVGTASSGAAPSAGTGQRTTEPSRVAGEGTTRESTEPEVSIEEQAAIAESFTRGLVDAFDLGASVSIQVEDEAILVVIDGANIGLLVGPKGATLTAIEELVRTVVQRQTDGRGARINVDVGGYRAKRREALEAFTRSLAEKVIETGRAQAL
jgi:spoIIIJ-associated protein